MELLSESHLDVAEDNYRLIPLRDNLLLLHGPRYVNVIKLGDSVLFSRQLGKDNTVKIMSPTHQGIFVFGDTLNDSAVRISFQESIYLLETLQHSDMNWGPDTEDISQRVEGFLQNLIPELQLQPQKKQQWLECILEGTYSDLEPLLEDISSQRIHDSSDQSATIKKMLQRLQYNASHHLKHPSADAVVSVAISHTEEIAVTGSSDGSIAIWDISKMPRLVNTISGPEGLVEVLLAEVVITVHKPNIVIVHQIGEHALSETLFQQHLEGVVVLGAAYVPATQKIVFVLNAIGSPAKACHFLQTASVNLEDHTLELSDRVRAEGNFEAIAVTNGTSTASINSEGQVALFDSSSSVITNTLQKPQSSYRFSDITSSSGHVYATTLAGAVLAFNLATIPPNPNSQENTANSADPFGDFSAPQDGNDDFGFGDFAASTPTATNGTPQRNGSLSFDEGADEFGFGDSSFATPAGASIPHSELSPKFTMDEPGTGITGSAASHNNSTGDFGELPRHGGLVDAGSAQSSPMMKPQRSLDYQESPRASPSLQARKSPSSTADFGDFGQFSTTSKTSPPAERKSPPPMGLGDFGQFSTTSPSAERKSPPPAELGDFGQFAKSPPVKPKSPQSNPFDTQLEASSASQHPFDDFRSQEQFGNSSSREQFGDFGSQGQLGDFGSQEHFGDFGAIPHSPPNGLSSSQHQPSVAHQEFKGDFGDFSDFSAPTSAPQQSNDFDFGQHTGTTQQNVGDLGDFGGFSSSPTSQQSNDFDFSQHTGTSQHQNVGDLGDFSTTAISTPPILVPLHSSTNSHTSANLHSSTNLHSSSSSHTSAPPTPGLNFRISASVLPGSPSIFSQDFHFETPPPTSLSQSGPFSPPSMRQSTDQEDFGGDFGSNFVETPATQTSPKPQQEAISPKGSTTLGDFGELATSSPQIHQRSGDFAFDDSSPTATDTQDNNGFGDFGENPSSAPQADDFGDFGKTIPATQSDDFGDFGETTPTTQKGDFGETAAQAHAFDDFGEGAEQVAGADEFGDFGERPTTHTDSLGDFGESPAPQASGSFEDFDDFSAPPQASETAAESSDDFGDFGDFSAPSADQKVDDDDFGDFGDFSKPQEATDDDFDDFGGFSGASSAQTQSDFGFGEAETHATPTAATAATPAVPTPTPTPQTPSIFTQDDKQLATTLNNTFSTAFASLVPPSLHSAPSTPHSSILAELDLEASLKGHGGKDSPVARNPKCTHCGVLLRSADAPSCLACGALAGPPQVSTWLGVVLPPIAEIKFWDALGVPLKQMTETNKDAQSLQALSSSQGILTPMSSSSTQSLPSTQQTKPTSSSSWDFSENPFAPNKATAATAPASKTSASTLANASATASTNARPAQHAAQNTRPPAAQGGLGGNTDFSPFSSSTSSQPPATIPQATSSGPSGPPPSSTPPARSADDDFFLSFNSSTPTPLTTATPSSTSSSTSTSSTPWTQFLARIPDLSFAVADHLVIPSH